MNVTFHILSAVGVTAALSSRQKNSASSPSSTSLHLFLLLVGFVAGLLLHGLLDWLPHSYPINSFVDVCISLALLMTAMVLVQRRHRLLLGVCALGSVLPDLLDLGPAIVNKTFGWSLPVFKLFPWHWRQYSGSIYDDSRRFESLLCHLVVVTASFCLLYIYRRNLFAEMRREQ